MISLDAATAPLSGRDRTLLRQAQDAVRRQSVGYRAVLRLPGGEDAIHLAEDEVRSWLVTKLRTRRNGSLDSADWEGTGEFVLGPDAVLSVVEARDDHGQTSRRLIRLVERNRGFWIVSVYAVTSGSMSSLIIETGRVLEPGEDSVLAVAPPRIVGNVLDRVEVRDGIARLTSTPQIVRLDDVGELIDVITDDERTTSVIVASSLGLETDEAWTKTVGSLTQYSVGVAAIYVVTHDAVAELNGLMPQSHAVPPGRIRTFAPAVDLMEPSDSLRHRVLGPATFARWIRRGKADKGLRATHASGIRRRLLELELPRDVRRTMRVLGEAEARHVRDARIDELVTEELGSMESRLPTVEHSAAVRTEPSAAPVDPQIAPPVGPPAPPVAEPVAARSGTIDIPLPWASESRPSGLLSRVGAFVKRWLKAIEPREEHFDELDRLIAGAALEQQEYERMFAEAGERESDLTDTIKFLNSRIEDLEVEAAIEAEEARKAGRERDWLRRELDADQRARLAAAPDDSFWDAPADVRELVARLTPGADSHPVLDRVVFTGDEDTAAEIDERDGIGRYAATLWSYVRVLHDYVEAKQAGYAGNVHMYLNDSTQLGAKCSPDRHASTESESVIKNRKLHAERVHNVPIEVDESGQIAMLAHFKPTHRDRFAPRMHYFDDAARSGKVYIGYIGRHLTTAKSS